MVSFRLAAEARLPWVSNLRKEFVVVVLRATSDCCRLSDLAGGLIAPHRVLKFSVVLFHVLSAAARALMSVEDMSAEEVAQRSMDVASDMCVYTNKEFLSYTLNDVGDIVVDDEAKK